MVYKRRKICDHQAFKISFKILTYPIDNFSENLYRRRIVYIILHETVDYVRKIY